ncbi:MAG TPA: hypothetical protein PK331_01305 [Gordonia sp. (in: high G+C Gram-positive bacteria)]|uniref:hypothetical protein n=2 Tax=Gordonia TaxID=2053 RepID=UPI000FABA88D|nr:MULTISPECIES: hypothetical protein [unclassified Gordonia (in: high G+C Gram-positive bacteria)]RUP39478.1 MAG: hypothetical protein EKK60_06705 [Gordonia sp. (in: high G+C Gram-positive bacteria)]HNP55962.1 hypothetical protein [Gordonia sp. (in: high G+C Gram-positive bacteria)]HRC49547.1 hypothetical protein [Gordonia sp. (in: high G+C Gram-positive bacteria)]
MKRAGKWLTIGGALVLVASIVGAVLVVIGVVREVSNFDSDSIAVSGPQGNVVDHHFGKGQKIALYTYGANGVYVGPIPNCAVTGPAPVRPGKNVTSSVTVNQRSRISFASYVIAESGTYRVACDSAGVTIAPPLSGAGIMGGVLGVFAASFGVILGLMALIAGIVLWVMASRRANRPPGPGQPPYWNGPVATPRSEG